MRWMSRIPKPGVILVLTPEVEMRIHAAIEQLQGRQKFVRWSAIMAVAEVADSVLKKFFRKHKDLRKRLFKRDERLQYAAEELRKRNMAVTYKNLSLLSGYGLKSLYVFASNDSRLRDKIGICTGREARALNNTTLVKKKESREDSLLRIPSGVPIVPNAELDYQEREIYHRAYEKTRHTNDVISAMARELGRPKWVVRSFLHENKFYAQLLKV